MVKYNTQELEGVAVRVGGAAEGYHGHWRRPSQPILVNLRAEQSQQQRHLP